MKQTALPTVYKIVFIVYKSKTKKKYMEVTGGLIPTYLILALSGHLETPENE